MPYLKAPIFAFSLTLFVSFITFLSIGGVVLVPLLLLAVVPFLLFLGTTANSLQMARSTESDWRAVPGTARLERITEI